MPKQSTVLERREARRKDQAGFTFAKAPLVGEEEEEPVPMIKAPSSVLSEDKRITVLEEIFEIAPIPIINCITFWLTHFKLMEADRLLKILEGVVDSIPTENQPLTNLVVLICTQVFTHPLHNMDFKSEVAALYDGEERKFWGKNFDLPDLVCFGLSKSQLQRETPLCFCNLESRLVPGRRWGAGVSASTMQCNKQKGGCRFQVQVRAYEYLLSYLDGAGEGNRLPLLYCPDHPSAKIAINGVETDDGQGGVQIKGLRVRCTGRSPDVKFCANSYTLDKDYKGVMSPWFIECLVTMYKARE